MGSAACTVKANIQSLLVIAKYILSYLSIQYTQNISEPLLVLRRSYKNWNGKGYVRATTDSHHTSKRNVPSARCVVLQGTQRISFDDIGILKYLRYSSLTYTWLVPR